MPLYPNAIRLLTKLEVLHPLPTFCYNYNGHTDTDACKYFIDIIEQKGGSKTDPEKIIIEYKNESYKFVKIDEYEDAIHYALHQNDSNTNKCIVIILEKDIHNCAIHELYYNPKCFKDKSYKGSNLLELALNFVDFITERYNIKTITVKDNSSKICNRDIRIELWLLSILTKGDTWYGKHGFIPVDERYKRYYENNKKIIKHTRMQQISFFKKMFFNSVYKFHKKNSDIANELDGLYKHYYDNDKKLKHFLLNFLSEYDIACVIFNDFYIALYDKLQLKNLYGISYIKHL